MSGFDSPDKEAEYEEFKKYFPALKIQKRGLSSTDNVVATPKRPTGMNSPTKGKTEVDLIEMSPNARVPKRA